MKRWVVRAGDGERVEDILRRAGEDARAIAEGRVFLGKKRVSRADEKVRPGDEVKIGAPQRVGTPAAAAGSGSRGGASTASPNAFTNRAPKGFSVERDPEVVVLFERDGLVACLKPAGIPTVPDHAGAAHALVNVVARKIGRDVGTMRITSRLDREVSGVVLFATDEAAETRLKKARDEGRYRRRYVAVTDRARALGQAGPLVVGHPGEPWKGAIGRAKDARLRAIDGPDAKPSLTRWAVAGTAGDAAFALLAVSPQTGRTHQIRLHASHAGAPLLGDRDYGGVARWTLPGGKVIATSRIALHAARVSVPDAHGGLLVVDAPIPEELRRVWAELGGEPEAWDRAVSCELDA